MKKKPVILKLSPLTGGRYAYRIGENVLDPFSTKAAGMDFLIRMCAHLDGKDISYDHDSVKTVLEKVAVLDIPDFDSQPFANGETIENIADYIRDCIETTRRRARGLPSFVLNSENSIGTIFLGKSEKISSLLTENDAQQAALKLLKEERITSEDAAYFKGTIGRDFERIRKHSQFSGTLFSPS